MATTLRVSEATRAHAAALAARSGKSIGEVVADALDAFETAEFWRRTHAALREQPREDDPAWDRTIRDNLEHG